MVSETGCEPISNSIKGRFGNFRTSPKHDQHSKQRTEEGSDRIHRLAKTESRAAKRERCHVGDQSVARRTAYAFADAIDKTGDKYRPYAGRERKERLGDAARPYPMSTKILRFPSQSLIAPEKMRETEVVASATPSMMPIESPLAPSIVTRNAGRRLWMISDDVSIHSETNPSAITAAGMERRPAVAGGGAFDSVRSTMPDNTAPARHQHSSTAVRSWGPP